jgi:hypothetical protein
MSRWLLEMPAAVLVVERWRTLEDADRNSINVETTHATERTPSGVRGCRGGDGSTKETVKALR